MLHLKSGKQLKTDIVLWANGRAGNSEDMGLEEIGITPNSRGLLTINESYQTEVPHIYAVGDVIGFPSLASAAYMQGRFASTHLMTGAGDHVMVREFPTGIYTSPEISSLGRTEKELTDQKIPYEIGHALFRSLARAQIIGRTTGMLKLLFHRETLQILGIHCFGSSASEIIHIGQGHHVAKRNRQFVALFHQHDFQLLSHPWPRPTEVAALNGYNRLF